MNLWTQDVSISMEFGVPHLSGWKMRIFGLSRSNFHHEGIGTVGSGNIPVHSPRTNGRRVVSMAHRKGDNGEDSIVLGVYG